MQIDSYFTKGVSHKVCEDYTMHGTVQGSPFIIVCDGCSGSNETDFGARLLARSAKAALDTLLEKYFHQVNNDNDRMLILHDAIIKNLSSMLKATNSDVSVADATLLLAFEHNGTVYITHRGDGAYAIGHLDGSITIVDINFPTGAPYYFSYDLDILNKRIYRDKFGGNKLLKQIRLRDVKNINFDFTTTVPYNDKGFFAIPVNEISFVSVMSDGINAFQYMNNFDGNRDPDNVSGKAIMKEILAYKNFKGEFVQRRMNKAIRTFTDNGIENFDDVSIATIKFGEG